MLLAYAGPASNVRVERTSRDCFSDGGALAEVMSLYENLSEDSRADHQVDNTEVMEQENHCLAIEVLVFVDFLVSGTKQYELLLLWTYIFILATNHLLCEICKCSLWFWYSLGFMNCLIIGWSMWGPSPITTFSGHCWFVIFVKDCNRMTWLYQMKTKVEVFMIFQAFHAMVQTQFSTKIQILRLDNGEEFINHEFQTYFQHHGLIHETSCS